MPCIHYYFVLQLFKLDTCNNLLQVITIDSKYCYSTTRGVETLSQLPHILAYFHHSYPAPHILCVQFSFNLPDIHQIYQTISSMTGCFHTTDIHILRDKLKSYLYIYIYSLASQCSNKLIMNQIILRSKQLFHEG